MIKTVGVSLGGGGWRTHQGKLAITGGSLMIFDFSSDEVVTPSVHEVTGGQEGCFGMKITIHLHFV